MTRPVALRNIAQVGHPVLRTPAQPVAPEEIESEAFQALVDDLIATMREASGAGLAAPQIHVPLRLCAMEVRDNPRYPYKPNIPLTVLVNPTIEVIGDERFENYEGCLSVPDLRGVVRRHARIRVRALDRHGAPIEIAAAGITAGTFQHEIDHLDGVLFLDRVEDPKTLCTWREFRRHHEADFREQVARVVATYGQ